MKIVSIIISILISHCVIGQDYINYYNQINKAKLHVVEGELMDAVQLYKKVFEKYEFVYARDCINAFEISCAINNHPFITYFIKCSLQKGVPISYFKNQSKLNTFMQTKLWENIILKSDSLNRTYQNSINVPIREEINNMFFDDQTFRELYYKKLNILFRPFILKNWKKLNARQTKRIIEITKEYGFPGEKLIGIDRPLFHPKINVNQMSAGMPIIILIHHYSYPNISYDSLLLEQVNIGNMYNEHFATICDFEAKFGKNKNPNFGFYGLRQEPVNTNKTMLDQKRKQIGLLTNTETQLLNKSNIMTKFWNRLR